MITACNRVMENTMIEIEDNNRHYYPILRGQQLDIVFNIKNTGSHTFMLSDIFSSCGCIVSKKSSIRSIPAGKTRSLILKYDSSKNIGYVKHYVTLYGNFVNTDKKEITFDLHVVPSALYTADYEEIYQKKKEKRSNIKNMVEGNENNKGYYIDTP